MRAWIDLVRAQHYDISIEELCPGRVAAAVPIVIDNRAIGGLAVSSTTVRETAESLREVAMPVLFSAAAEIASAYRNATPQMFRASAR